MLCELGWSIYTRIYLDGLLVVGPGVSEGGEGELLLGDGGAGLQQPAHVRTRRRSSVLKYRQHCESLSEHDSCFACYCLVKIIFSCFWIGSGSGRIRVFSPIRIRTRGPGSDTLMMYDYIVCSVNNHNTTSLNFYTVINNNKICTKN